ncbi:unnamed protein product [Cuscuta epithymum]|uniref:Calmodulin-binding protein n=1 Tax=Cuscuta epithymum TaxID=186058 RepID=A0AAV0E3T4_9ASTE|nr:unnamed protein product [Cuscuta epithymum]
MGTPIPSPPQAAVDFNFDSACTTPFISAPSSPQRFSSGVTPVSWEQNANEEEEEENICESFDFEFSGPLEKTYFSAADELFDSGKIKPLKPPPPAITRPVEKSFRTDEAADGRLRRGREARCSSNHRHKATRSLSPFRVSDLLLDRKQSIDDENSPVSFTPSFISTVFSGKWKLKDLLLFRSSSEGRPSSTVQWMKNYTNSGKNGEEDEGSSGSSSISRRRRVPPAQGTPEFRHYTVRRTAVPEDLKRKTFLPYKQGILGCLGFYNPSAAHREFSCRGSSSFASVSIPR